EARHHAEAQHHPQSKDCQLKECDCQYDPYRNHFIEYYKAFDPKTFSDKFILCRDDDEQEDASPLPIFPTAPPISTAVNMRAPGATRPFAMPWRPLSPGRGISLVGVRPDPPCDIGRVSNIPRLPEWP